MNAADIAVVAADVVAAAGLGWWFFGPKPAAEAAVSGGVQEVRVTVRGGYSPSRIQVRAGVPVRIRFSRQESGTAPPGWSSPTSACPPIFPPSPRPP